MTSFEDDPIVEQLMSLHAVETARAVEDLKRPATGAVKPRVHTLQPSLLGLGVVVVVLVVVASAGLFGGLGSPESPTPGASAQPTNPVVGASAGPTSSIARAETTEGPFQLLFELPKDTWSADEAIEGLATLSLVEGSGIDIGGSRGLRPLGYLPFDFAEVNGSRHLAGVSTLECGGYRLEAGQPITSPITRSGGFSPDDPNAVFYRAFIADPMVHLPAGDWRITAVARFAEGEHCTGRHHDMRASILVHVLPASGAVASPSPGDPVDAFAGALTGAGAAVRRSDPLQASPPFQMPGVKLCVDNSSVRVYVYPDAGQLEAVVKQIDPEDPSHIGSSIVDWIGPPRLWQRDRLLVMYLGDSQATEDLLTSMLGAPFARGAGGKSVAPVDGC